VPAAMTDPWLFLLALLAILGAPGPTNTLLATAGATAGIRRPLALLGAELAGYTVSIGVIRVAIGPILAAVPPLLIVLKVAVAVYLVFVAITVWRRALTLGSTSSVSFAQVFIATLLNPKAVILALTIFPREPLAPLLHILLFAAMTVATGFAWIILGHTLSAATGEHGARLIPRVAAVALGGFAGLILYSAFA
jgi:threonine/homoserine/homoserine lactone efflux protein